jgi:hypothetical protein
LILKLGFEMFRKLHSAWPGAQLDFQLNKKAFLKTERLCQHFYLPELNSAGFSTVRKYTTAGCRVSQGQSLHHS